MWSFSWQDDPIVKSVRSIFTDGLSQLVKFRQGGEDLKIKNQSSRFFIFQEIIKPDWGRVSLNDSSGSVEGAELKLVSDWSSDGFSSRRPGQKI